MPKNYIKKERRNKGRKKLKNEGKKKESSKILYLPGSF